jgi:adenylate cyclase
LAASTQVHRRELETGIEQDMAEMLIAACGERRIVEKMRHGHLGDDGKVWVIDVFSGANAGLVLAEIELGHQGETFEQPLWAILDVTQDERYYNEYLADHPYSTWAR